MSRFAGLKAKREQTNRAVEEVKIQAEAAGVPFFDSRDFPKPKNPRVGKKAIVGYFSPAVSKGMHQLAVDLDSNIQALLGEAIDDLMRKHGKHPFGER